MLNSFPGRNCPIGSDSRICQPGLFTKRASQAGRSKIGRRIASITRIIKIAMVMKNITTPLVDIFMIAVASRLLQSAESIENGLTGFLTGLFNGYIEMKENDSVRAIISFYLNDGHYQWKVRHFSKITTNDGRYGILF
jgi:hypothetical protein